MHFKDISNFENLNVLTSSKESLEILDLSESTPGIKVTVGGIITSVKKMMTKKGMKMFKLNIEDLTSGMEVIIFPKEAKSISDDYFLEGDIVIFNGSVSRDGDEENSAVKVIYSSSEKIDSTGFSGGKPIMLKSLSMISNESIESIYDIINNTNGASTVFLEMQDSSKKYTFKFNKTTSIKIEKQLQDIVNMS